MDAATAGLLASVGVGPIDVVRRPVVGLVSTGDELVDSGAQVALGKAQIFDANRVVLAAMVAQAGFETVDLGRIPDDEAALEALVQRCPDVCDVLVSTGGASFGERDIVRSYLSSQSSSVVHAMEVGIKPGKPQVFAVVNEGSTRVFGLPGNLVAAAVSFELFVRPALRRLAGRGGDDVHRKRVTVEAGEDFLRRPDGRVHLRPVAFSPGQPPLVHSQGRKGSHILTSLRAWHGLVLLPDGFGVGSGSEVSCLVLDPEALISALASEEPRTPPCDGDMVDQLAAS